MAHLWQKAAWASAFFFFRKAISDMGEVGSSSTFALKLDLSLGGEWPASTFTLLGM
jgi:hypothetical protein